jgi:3',5'-cyclic AMP phosphodiesterase CpdA
MRGIVFFGQHVRSTHFPIGLVTASALCSALITACGGSTPASPTAPTTLESKASAGGPSAPVAAEAVPDEVFVGAGDIARCGMGDPEATAKLLDRIPGTVFTLGDNVQDLGGAEEYEKCFEPSWGRHRWRMLPTVGNHDWFGGHGRPYFSYFGPSAGPAGAGYYSQRLGAWHVISLNSEVASGPGSPQYEWLKADLAASATACTLVMWHRPLFSSGPNENAAHMRDAWRLLSQYGADLVLSGHNHTYERFAPQNADGRLDPNGPRQFVVGTGGYPMYGRARMQANSEVFESDTWGVLKLTLKSGSYAWEFVPVAPGSFRDSGTAACVAPAGR